MSKLVKLEGMVRYDPLDNGIIEEAQYETEIIINDFNGCIGEIRSLIRKMYIKKHLTELKKANGHALYKNIKHIPEMQVVDVTETDDKSKGNSQLEQLLTEAIKLHCVPENLDKRTSDAAKISALKVSIEKLKARNKKKPKEQDE